MLAGLRVTTSLTSEFTAVSEPEPTALTTQLPRDTRISSKGQFAKAVGAFVPKVTAAVFQKFGFHSAEIMASWPTIVGSDVARLTRPESIKWPRGSKAAATEGDDEGRSAGATLIVATDPAFALEVSYRHKEIIDRINRYFGYRAIGQLKVHQVPGSIAAATPSPPPSPAPASAPSSRGGGDLATALEALGRSVTAARTR